ncbi:hypothetical protein [Xanthomonas campestris]|uniref:hypothetical protein n=1 Tax=Xanthomonas campestris TaxID=339 RepID=UPI0005AF2E4F|nr:hypothetical protein [Xanthomonas campestris]KIQ21574.1 hypothetical protein RT95_20740 [Xanthomonas campestris]
MNAQLNYARMPGPGDLGFPDEEPAFDRDDAINLVVDYLVKEDEAAELVMQVANCSRLLTLIGREFVIPETMHADWAALESTAKHLDRKIESELAILNGVAA